MVFSCSAASMRHRRRSSRHSVKPYTFDISICTSTKTRNPQRAQSASQLRKSSVSRRLRWHLKQFVVRHERRQLREGLPPRPADAKQQSVALRLQVHQHTTRVESEASRCTHIVR